VAQEREFEFSSGRGLQLVTAYRSSVSFFKYGSFFWNYLIAVKLYLSIASDLLFADMGRMVCHEEGDGMNG
jgi:hypothetical protein